MKLAIVGSRSWSNAALLKRTLDQYAEVHGVEHHITVISGGAAGADSMGEAWARKNGYPVEVIRPDWERYGRSAGFKRNEDIIREADIVFAFWDGSSKGTLDSINKARRLGIEVRVITEVLN